MCYVVYSDEGADPKLRLIRELKSYTSANRMILTGTPLHVRLSVWILPVLATDCGCRTISQSFGLFSTSSFPISLTT